MEKNLKWALNRLPYSFKLQSNKLGVNYHPQLFGLFENLLYNVYGYPAVRLSRSTENTSQLYWKKNREGVWARTDNTFHFATKEMHDMLRDYIPREYKIVK